jgi:uroporphyrinogen-III decarboxylase
MAFIGNIPTVLLARGSQSEIEERVREYCIELGPGGGYVLGSSTSIMDGIPPKNFVAMIQAVHKYGRYGSLGEAVQ